jgi:hypothetical protein
MNDEIQYQYFSSVLAIVNGFDTVRVCNTVSPLCMSKIISDVL